MENFNSAVMGVQVAEMFYTSSKQTVIQKLKKVEERGNKADLGDLMSLSLFTNRAISTGEDLRRDLIKALKAYYDLNFFRRMNLWGSDKKLRNAIKILEAEISKFKSIREIVDKGEKEIISKGVKQYFDNIFQESAI